MKFELYPAKLRKKLRSNVFNSVLLQPHVDDKWHYAYFAMNIERRNASLMKKKKKTKQKNKN